VDLCGSLYLHLGAAESNFSASVPRYIGSESETMTSVSIWKRL